MHAERHPWDLLKELIQNAWDEAPKATFCRINVRHPSENETVVTVEDDGSGFSNPADSYTLLGDTDKRRDPKKRGRFNMGEKEAISVALEATVETVGQSIHFPRIGGRVIDPNTRKRGTKITLVMPWPPETMSESIDRLMMFRPTDCDLFINRRKVKTREPIATRSCVLPTVLQDGPGEPLRRTKRRTDIHVLSIEKERKDTDPETGQSVGGWIFEMGIPIQPISAGYDVDVMQKVPMPPNRTTVPDSYLKDIYAELLNATAHLMEDGEFAQTWTRTAVENERRMEQKPLKTYFERKYGDKTLLTSSDANSNMKAAEGGYQLINPRSMSVPERKQARATGMKSSHELFGQKPATDMTPIKSTDDMNRFAEWVVSLASAARIPDTTVQFISDPSSRLLACCAGNRRRSARFSRSTPAG